MPDEPRAPAPVVDTDSVLAVAARIRDVVPGGMAVALFFFGTDDRVHFIHNTGDADAALDTVRCFLDADRCEPTILRVPSTS